MDCSRCEHTNTLGSRFCEQCGSALERACPSCGAGCSPGAKFCRECGSALEGGTWASTPTAPPERVARNYTPRHLADKILRSRSALEGERKQVTVLFADVTRSMELAEQLDPEEWHRILDRFFEILSEGVNRFEGTVNQYLGDGIMALFGAPIAHEDHAQRACYAALWLRDELGIYSRELKRERGLGFSVRMGLHAGEVVVGKIGDDLRMDYTAQGHSVGLAARLQSLASPDTCYLSSDVADLVQGYFDLNDLGEFKVKGVSEPVTVFELRGMGAVRTRFDVSMARGLSRFVGRADDFQTLETALAQAQAGDGQVVGIVAEAGVGKSRLSFEFLEACRAKGLRTLEGRAVSHGKSIPLLPILQAFRDYFEIDERDVDRRVREKIVGRMMLFDESHRDDLPVLFDFFGVPDPDHPVPPMSPDTRQRRLFNVLRRSVQRDSGRGTTVTLIEDLHWLDAASEAWLEEWVDAHAGSQNLLVVNTRPEYRAAWMQKPWYRQIPLRPLGPEAIAELLDDLLGDEQTVEALASRIFERTAGNPFFAEEVIRTLVESGNLAGEKGSYRLVVPVERIEVPANVQSLLAARIDRLAEDDKRLLQTAAVLGKEFSETVLVSVAKQSREELAPILQRLKAADFIYEESLYPVVEYAFKHPLTQAVALEGQLRENRRAVHERAAKAIEDERHDRLDEVAALIAHHWEGAGRKLEAARWHARAARFIGKSNFAEEQRHHRRVRDLVRALSESDEAPALGADACRSILALSFRLGVEDDERDAAFEEGLGWAKRTGEPFYEARMYQAMSVAVANRGHFDDAIAHGENWQRIAATLPQDDRRNVQHWPLLNPMYRQGRLEELRTLCEWQVQQTREHPDWGMRDWQVSAFADAVSLLGGVEALEGNPERGAELTQQAIDGARSVPELEGESWGLLRRIEIDTMMGDVEHARRLVPRLLEIDERIGSLTTRSWIHLSLGRLLLLEARPDDARNSIMIAEDICSTHYRSDRSDAATALAECALALGETDRGIELAKEALHEATEMGAWLFAMRAALTLAACRHAAGAEPQLVHDALDQAESLIRQTGAVIYEPRLLELRDLATR
jgi:class 3 adenylate cyclase/tetratricopeptide (TPR) repeat protein